MSICGFPEQFIMMSAVANVPGLSAVLTESIITEPPAGITGIRGNADASLSLFPAGENGIGRIEICTWAIILPVQQLRHLLA